MIIWEICITSIMLNYVDKHESYLVRVHSRESTLKLAHDKQLKGQICTLGAGIIEFRLNKLKTDLYV